jgi:hypothetical protein
MIMCLFERVVFGPPGGEEHRFSGRSLCVTVLFEDKSLTLLHLRVQLSPDCA